MKFHTTLLQSGKTAVGMRVPDEIVEALAAGKRPPVRVTINGYTYRNTIAVMGGVFMVGVSAENREKAGVAGGEEVDVDIELDPEPRELVLPHDFAAIPDRERRPGCPTGPHRVNRTGQPRTYISASGAIVPAQSCSAMPRT